MHWWQKKDNNHDIVFKTVNAIQERQNIMNSLDDRHYKLYSGQPIYSVFSNVNEYGYYHDKLVINVVQMSIESLLSKMTKSEPRVTFLTDNADWSKQVKAEALDEFVHGQFYKSETYKNSKKAALDAFIWGDGFIKVFNTEEKGKPVIKTNRKATPFIVVDEREAVHGEPSTVYEFEFVDKEALIQRFPKFQTEIREAKSSSLSYFQDMIFDHNLVLVLEAWKEADENGKGGRHFVGINNATFINEDYHRDYLPFSRMSYQRNPLGYRSKGVAQLLTGHQIELNRAMNRLQDSFRMSAPKWLYAYSSKIVKTHFNNLVGGMIGYEGTPPQYYAPAPVPPQHFDYIFFIIQKSLEEIGLNQLTVTGTKPAGLNSGAALREHNDIETERFASLFKDWEKFHVDLALRTIKEAQYLAKQGKPIVVNSPVGSAMKVIDFKDVNMELDSFIMQPYPTSMIPKQPFGRLEFIQDMINMQMLDPQEGMMLLDFPDTKGLTSRKYAARKDIEAVVSRMVNEGEYLPPEEFQDLEFGVTYCQYSYLYYKNRNCPQDRLDLLDQWINDALEILNPAPPEQEMMGDVTDIEGMEEQVSQDDLLSEEDLELPEELEAPVDPSLELPEQL